jgi:hypothetical protein
MANSPQMTDFFKSMAQNPEIAKSYMEDPLGTLADHGIDPATVDMELVNRSKSALAGAVEPEIFVAAASRFADGDLA